MKILILHNDYGRHSGEEAVVDGMAAMLKAYGHAVSFYRPSTANHQAGLGNKLQVFLSGVYSFRGVREIRRVLRTEKPDIINIHNLYPFISPAALFAFKEAGIPVVMTVHNYRLICPTGLFLRDGRPCELCLHRGDEWGCIRFNCEKDIFKSAGYALRGAVARKMGAYQKNVDRYVCLTAFQREKLVMAGFPREKIEVIPNSVEAPSAGVGGVEAGDVGAGGVGAGGVGAGGVSAVGSYIAYVGRLSEEKGWDMLVEVAERNPGLRIEVAGDGGEGSGGAGRRIPGNIRFRGFLGESELAAFYREARFVVIPSRCYEGFPLVALEAMAMGKPVVAPDHGGFTEIVGKGEDAAGRLFRPNDLLHLETVMLALWENASIVEEMGRKAMSRVREQYAAEIVYRKWEHLLQEVYNSRVYEGNKPKQ